jgi:DNA-binding Lrp family transcriptional regulator
MPTKRSEYTKVLNKLSASLRRKPMTARAIAEAFNCCRPVAYERLRALEKRGETVFQIRIRESVTGPQSTAYGVR